MASPVPERQPGKIVHHRARIFDKDTKKMVIFVHHYQVSENEKVFDIVRSAHPEPLILRPANLGSSQLFLQLHARRSGL